MPPGESEPQHTMHGPHSERMLGFMHELHTQADERATGDSRIAAFAIAASRAVTQNDNFRSTIHELLDFRPDISPNYAVNLTLRAIQKQLTRESYRRKYPEAYTNPDLWSRAIAEVSNPTNLAENDEFMWDIMYRHVQSNIAERYKSFTLLMHLMRNRFEDAPSILDIGCSQNQGLKRIAISHILPFAPFQSVIEDGREAPGLEIQILNRLVGTPLKLGPSIGIDIMHPRDVSNKEWARSCSFYPSELLLDQRREEYDLLDTAEPPQVGFYAADFTHFDHEDFSKESPVKKFDMVTFSTVLYQISDEAQRQKMLDNARRLMKPNGLIIVQDFVTVDPADNTRMVFHPNWFEHTFLYATMVIDPLDPTGQIREVFRWENGRCRRMMAGHELGRIMLFMGD